MILKQPVKYLLVDLDGTLLGNRNVRLSIDFVRRSVTALSHYGGVRKAISTLIAVKNEFERPSRELANDVRVVELFAKRLKLQSEDARKLIRENLRVIFPELERHFYPVQGSRDFLEWARHHYPIVLTTNPVWPPEIVELRVKWAGIDPRIFRSMTHARRMHACKPTPEFYQEVLDQEGLSADECLLIGDDLKMDLPATRVGIRVFIVGKYKRLTSLKHPRARAPAWRGSYDALRSLLETRLGSTISQ